MTPPGCSCSRTPWRAPCRRLASHHRVTVEVVKTTAGADGIVAQSTIDCVGSAAAKQCILATAAPGVIRATATKQGVSAVSSVHPPGRPVIAAATGHVVVPIIAEQPIAATTAIDM